jgi:peptidoglycan hydrolase CwlO-like protein
MTKKIFLLLFFVLATFFLTTPIKADETEDLQNKISEYTQKLNELGASKNTLANQIKILTSQYELTQLKITQTENSIKGLEQEINNLSVEIDKLNIQLNDLSQLFVYQTAQNYKNQRKAPLFFFLLNSKLNDFLQQNEYVSSVRQNSQDNLIKMGTIKENYDIQKTAKTKKQQDMETLQKTLATQKISLNSQKVAKDQLLAITKNDEKKYQQLLTEAQNQLSALRNFSKSLGSTCLSSSPGGGSDGNFYSQRDPRWCNQYIGNSKDTIGEVGCFLSSVSMVYKKIGSGMTPSSYAADSSNFWSNTAYMVTPSAPSGYTYKQVSYNISTIDNELKAGRYVIAQMRMSTVAGMHFIVIISGSNGSYKVHDPWYGPDQNFSDHYSPSLVMSLRLFTK